MECVPAASAVYDPLDRRHEADKNMRTNPLATEVELRAMECLRTLGS